jgi:hypothetical protein
MSLQDLLLRAQSEIVEQWFHSILASYPADTAKFLDGETDRFRNPVGQTTRTALESLFAGIVGTVPVAELRPPLDEIIRIRAVQDFSASDAIGFLMQLKPLLRKRLRGASFSNGNTDSLNKLDARIDSVTLLGFDIYVECREQVYDIKANALRRRTEILLEHMNRKGGGD